LKRLIVTMLALGVTAGVAWAQDHPLAADVNRDGAITRAEAAGARAAMFERIDTNGDGYISPVERAAAIAAAQRRRGFQRVDADNDGRISRAEFTRQPLRLFDHFDADNNGVLSGSEIDAMRSAAQRRRR
jgi:hypothetical protein